MELSDIEDSEQNAICVIILASFMTLSSKYERLVKWNRTRVGKFHAFRIDFTGREFVSKKLAIKRVISKTDWFLSNSEWPSFLKTIFENERWLHASLIRRRTFPNTALKFVWAESKPFRLLTENATFYSFCWHFSMLVAKRQCGRSDKRVAIGGLKTQS